MKINSDGTRRVQWGTASNADTTTGQTGATPTPTAREGSASASVAGLPSWLQPSQPVELPPMPPVPPKPVIFSKQGYLVRLTDEQAADVWPVEVLTPEEQELARKVERVQSERLLEEYRERLAKADPALQPIIEHHWVDERWTCQGCDAGSYAEDSPDWPCSTIDLILEGLE